VAWLRAERMAMESLGAAEPGGRPRGADVFDARAHAGTPVLVAVQASDTILGTGAVSYLRSRPGILPIPAGRAAEADAILVLADHINDDIIAWMQQAADRLSGPAARFVLVIDLISVPQLRSVANCGPVTVLPRQGTSYEQVVRAIFQTQQEDVDGLTIGLRLLPTGRDVTGSQGSVAGPGRIRSPLRDREINVLRLVAEGLDTAEIAEQLSYSERTIKNVLHAMLNRLQLKNRPHAVAFALRNRLI
jgi:DNA-binding NarL/FixJ family response regulator